MGAHGARAADVIGQEERAAQLAVAAEQARLRAGSTASTLQVELEAAGWTFHDLERQRAEWPERVARAHAAYATAMGHFVGALAAAEGVDVNALDRAEKAAWVAKALVAIT